jgi:hypothetical protein
MTDETMLIAVEEAARELGITALAVLMQVKRERLAGVEREGRWFVSRASLAAFRAAAGGAGPELCRSACARKAHCGSCS